MPELRTLMTSIALGESPRWHDGRLWFSDWGVGEIIAIDEQGNSEVVARLSAAPFCFDWLPVPGPHGPEPEQKLLIVSGQEGLLLRKEPDGSLVTHADLRGLSTYAWNEIVVDGRGNAYVNSINFSFPGGEFAPGIVALVTPDGSVRQVAEGVAFPNGMVITPDNATLIVAESYANQLTAFSINLDGSLGSPRVWAHVGDGYPDGICLDAEGAVWYADVPNRRCVRVREGGEVLQTVEVDRGCFACMLGGTDNRTLFIVAAEWGGRVSTADGQRTGKLLAVEAPAPKAGRP